MKKILTNADIANIVAYSQSESAATRSVTSKFPVKFTFAFRKNMAKINKIFDVYSKMADEISTSYADDEHSYEQDDQRLVKDEYIKEYNDKLRELVSVENTVDIHVVPAEMILDSNVELSVPELEVLDFMLDYGEDETDEIEKVTVEVE